MLCRMAHKKGETGGRSEGGGGGVGFGGEGMLTGAYDHLQILK